MSTENLDCIYSLPAAADMTDKEGYPVVVNTSGQWALAGANVVPHGHIHDGRKTVKAGEMLRVVHHGKVLRYRTGGIVTLGAKLATHANGYAVATTGQAVVGIALKASASGVISRGLFLPGLPAA